MEINLKEVSQMVSHTVRFVWEIKDFPENVPLLVMASPPFKCQNTDFRLELSHNDDNPHTTYLRLVQSSAGELPWISSCRIGFNCPHSEGFFQKFTAPVKLGDISNSICAEDLNMECLVSDFLSVECQLEVLTLEHNLDVRPVTLSEGDQSNSSKKGFKTLSESFGEILEDSRFSDVTLKVGEETFPAHKAILSSRSKVFGRMFDSGMKESRESVVDIAEMEPATMKKMLQYIYSGTVERLSVREAIDLNDAAERYDLRELKEWCRDFIQKHITPDDVLGVALTRSLLRLRNAFSEKIQRR